MPAACVVQPAGLKLPPLAKTCFSELIENQGTDEDSHIIDVPSSGKRKKMPKKKSQEVLAEPAAGDPGASSNGKKIVTQESEAKDTDQLVIWR